MGPVVRQRAYAEALEYSSTILRLWSLVRRSSPLFPSSPAATAVACVSLWLCLLCVSVLLADVRTHVQGYRPRTHQRQPASTWPATASLFACSVRRATSRLGILISRCRSLAVDLVRSFARRVVCRLRHLAPRSSIIHILHTHCLALYVLLAILTRARLISLSLSPLHTSPLLACTCQWRRLPPPCRRSRPYSWCCWQAS